MYTDHALINALSAHMIHINLNMMFYTHVEHSSSSKTIYISKVLYEKINTAGPHGFSNRMHMLANSLFSPALTWKHLFNLPKQTNEQLASSSVRCCFTSAETEGLLGAGAQEGHLHFHTAPELWNYRLLLSVALRPQKPKVY